MCCGVFPRVCASVSTAFGAGGACRLLGPGADSSYNLVGKITGWCTVSQFAFFTFLKMAWTVVMVLHLHANVQS